MLLLPYEKWKMLITWLWSTSKCISFPVCKCHWELLWSANVLVFNADVIIWSIDRFCSVLLNASAARWIMCIVYWVPLYAWYWEIFAVIYSFMHWFLLFSFGRGIEKSFVPFSAPLCSGLSILLPGSQSCITLWTKILSLSFLFSPCLSLFNELLRVSFVFGFFTLFTIKPVFFTR